MSHFAFSLYHRLWHRHIASGHADVGRRGVVCRTLFCKRQFPKKHAAMYRTTRMVASFKQAGIEEPRAGCLKAGRGEKGIKKENGTNKVREHFYEKAVVALGKPKFSRDDHRLF